MTANSRFSRELLEWFPPNVRLFPWRRTKDPYRILVTELFLRKTTARQVNEIFKPFFSRFPTPRSLHNASRFEIAREIGSLGMGKVRTAILQRLAASLVSDHRNVVPTTKESLLLLPGVGEYTANATLCFAFGKRVPLVDVNVVRVIRRVFNISSTRQRARDDPRIWDFVENQLLPKRSYQEFNTALIDFAALICQDRKPRCDVCFARTYCEFYNRTSRQN
jgi:A/G-specific adenine glycosylase